MNKETDSEILDNDEEGLPDLTPNQQGFVQSILKGETASDAYRKNYSAENMTDNSIWCESSKLRNNAKVTQWLNTIRQEQQVKATVTLQSHIDELERLKTISVSNGNMGAAVQATVSQGKAQGLYIERHEDLTPSQDTDIIEGIRSLLGDDFAEAAAKRLGL